MLTGMKKNDMVVQAAVQKSGTSLEDSLTAHKDRPEIGPGSSPAEWHFLQEQAYMHEEE